MSGPLSPDVAALDTAEPGQHSFDLADRHRLSGGGMERDFGGLQQIFGVEAGSKALQPHRSDMPVAIAPRPLQQIKLLCRAFEKGRTQLAQQGGVIAGRCRKGRIKGPDWVKAGFIRIPGVV